MFWYDITLNYIFYLKIYLLIIDTDANINLMMRLGGVTSPRLTRLVMPMLNLKLT